MEAWEHPRYEQLYRALPDIWNHKSILYVGAHEGRIQFGEPIREHELEIDVLEIWKPNVEHLRESVPWFNQVIEGDIREIGKSVSHKYDIVFWWHGPEHISKEELFLTLQQIEQFANHYVVLGCPWGTYDQGEEYGNPYEVHRNALYERDFQRYGYHTSTIGRRDVPGSNLLAWKDLTVAPEFTSGTPIAQGVGCRGELQLTLAGDFDQVKRDIEILRHSRPHLP
ncbi:MAG: hypothetical protein V2A61_06040, partial [Calditrichota bacterium]